MSHRSFFTRVLVSLSTCLLLPLRLTNCECFEVHVDWQFLWRRNRQTDLALDKIEFCIDHRTHQGLVYV